MKAMDTLANEGMTIVIVAHRPNVLRYADKIIVLRDGMLDDYGFRDDILEKLQGAARPQLQKLTEEEPDSISSAPNSLPKQKVPPQPADTKVQNSEEAEQSNIARLQRLKSIKNKAARRARQQAQRPNGEGAAIHKMPTKEPTSVQRQPDPKKLPPMTADVREEIIALADRELSEEEIQEIYTLYASGDRSNMLKKLKGLG